MCPLENRDLLQVSSFLRAQAVALALCGAFASCAGRSDATRAEAADASPAPAMTAVNDSVEPRGGTPGETCVAVMHRTRDCADVYVPGLLALRVRLDMPAGIAKRFEMEGKDAMLGLAHSQFSRDWSNEAIVRNCEALSEKPTADQERIVAPDRRCLEMPDCGTFTACDLAHKEKRWTESP